jgi:hypothetical protein
MSRSPLNKTLGVTVVNAHRREHANQYPLESSFHPGAEQKQTPMAKPNYAFAKRQRDLAKKQKNEEKRLRKAGAKEPEPQAEQQPLPTDNVKTPPDGS